MSLEQSIERNCNQTAVYWGNPVNDGYGGWTFDSPIEILCRWEDRREVVSGVNGDQVVSRSVVYVLQDIDRHGYLFLGTLADLTGEDTLYPKTIEAAYEVERYDKVPLLGRTDRFLRTAYLQWRL